MFFILHEYKKKHMQKIIAYDNDDQQNMVGMVTFQVLF